MKSKNTTKNSNRRSKANQNTIPSDGQIESLLQIVDQLRGPNGCPWDKVQNHKSLTQYTIEEAHELVESIETGSDERIKDELGDVLFQVVLHSRIAQERKAFAFNDVVRNINQKMIRRHPHVFGNKKVKNADDVIRGWDEIKRQERKDDSTGNFNIPCGMPALQRASKIGKKTAQLNFDWKTADQVWLKVKEEFEELREARGKSFKRAYKGQRKTNKIKCIEHEIGDLFFSLAQLCRHLDLDPEAVARLANRRFQTRFELMLQKVAEDQLIWDEIKDSQKAKYWEKVKKELNGRKQKADI